VNGWYPDLLAEASHATGEGGMVRDKHGWWMMTATPFGLVWTAMF